MDMPHTYICIALKSFYISVECQECELDPLATNLVVADESRTEKTICLAVTPSLKIYGIPGRARLFDVVQNVKETNTQRQRNAPRRKLSVESYGATKLIVQPELKLSYIAAPPRVVSYVRGRSTI